MLWAQSTIKDYIRAEHKLLSVSQLIISQVMIPQVMLLFCCCCCFLLTYLYSSGTQHGNLHPGGWPSLFCGPTQEPELAAANTGKTSDGFAKNAGKWTGRVESSKEEIPGSKRSMYGYILTYPRLLTRRQDFSYRPRLASQHAQTICIHHSFGRCFYPTVQNHALLVSEISPKGPDWS